MIKRPLCMVCLIFLIIQGFILIIRGGQSLVEMPASSIFWNTEGQEITVTGEVYNKKNTSNNQILYLKNNSISNQENYIVYDSNFTNISIGEQIRITGVIQQFDRAHNPGNFDQALYYAKEKIYGTIFAEKIVRVKEADFYVQEKLYQLKMQWKGILIDNLGKEQGNVLSAMILGEKSEMDEELKELYQKNGIGHILAISGLHISFVGLGIYKLFRKAGIPFGIAGLVAFGILSLYGIMIGFSVSVFRACVMLFIKIGADITGRVYDMLTAIMLSAAITIWYQPLYLTDAGFYLSYGAVLGLLILVPYVSTRMTGKWSSLFVPGICVNIFLLPIQLWYYYEFPIYSIFLNIVVIPLMSAVLSFGIVGSGLYVLSYPLGRMSLLICKGILLFYERISEWGLKLPLARLVTGRPEWWELMLYYLILSMILLRVISKKSIIIMSYILGLFLLVHTPKGNLAITMLDVGQGDGIFIKGPSGKTYLIDGGSSDVKDLGKYRIESFLKHEGVQYLNYVFVSHGDTDHYSGILEMLSRQEMGVEIRNLLLPENYKSDTALMQLAATAKEMGTKVYIMKANTKLKEKELEICCLQPHGNSEGTGNEGSMVLEVSYKEFQMLCTGDVEGCGEEILTKSVKGKNYEVLKVSHHGSKSSSQKEFMDAISVKTALISAGRNNPYGHPHDETLRRLEEEGCSIYQTSESGAVTILTDGKEMWVEVFH